MKSNNGILNIVIAVAVFFIALKTCSNINDSKRSRNSGSTVASNWQKSPVDKLIQEMESLNSYSIILSDMNVENPNSSNPVYKHKYKLIKELEDTVLSEQTPWYDVSDNFFQKHIDNLGMEIVSKKDGKVTKEAAPAGYNNYVGNPRYGQWTERNGSSFWEFYGRYAFMVTMFDLMTYPARRSYWNDYNRNYYGTGRGYYGPSGKNIYGTKTYTSSRNGQNSQWGRKSSDFKSQVRNKVSRSTTSSKSRSYSSSSPYQKTTRSTSRSYGSTSYRSRSGGYGK